MGNHADPKGSTSKKAAAPSTTTSGPQTTTKDTLMTPAAPPANTTNASTGTIKHSNAAAASTNDKENASKSATNPSKTANPTLTATNTALPETQLPGAASLLPGAVGSTQSIVSPNNVSLLPSFTFGVEIELLVESKQSDHILSQFLIREVVHVLQTTYGVDVVANSVWTRAPREMRSTNKPKVAYTTWQISEESIAGEGSAETLGSSSMLLGMEVISPIFKYDEHDVWVPSMTAIWKGLRDYLTVFEADGASTHVHVAPASAKWSMGQLRCLAKSIFYFDQCFNAYFQAQDREDKYCVSNLTSVPIVKLKTMPAIFKALDACADVSALATLTSSGPVDGEGYPDPKGKKIEVHRYFRWNFVGLSTGDNVTLENRRPPASYNVDDTVFWSQFTCCYVAGSLMYANILDPSRPAQPQMLEDFIVCGARATNTTLEFLSQVLIQG